MPSTFPKRFHDYEPFALKVKDLSAVKSLPPNAPAIRAALHADKTNDGESLAEACMLIEERLERIKAMPEFKGEKGVVRNSKLNPELEQVMDLAIKKLPPMFQDELKKHITSNHITIEAGKVKIKIPSDEYFNAVANMVKRVSDLLLNKLNKDPHLTAEMPALMAALEGFENYKAKNPILNKAGMNAKLNDYKGGLTTLTKERMVEHLDQLSVVKCNNFFANLDKHKAILLDSKDTTVSKFKEIMGSDACGELINKLAAAPNMSVENVNAAIDAVYKVLAQQLHNHVTQAGHATVVARAAQIAEDQAIREDFPGQKTLATTFNDLNLAVAQAIQKSGMPPTDYPKNDMAMLYALAQNVAEASHAYTSKLDGDKSESNGHQNKMAEFGKIQREVAAEIAKYNGTNCKTILAKAQEIINTSLTNKFEKKRPLFGNGDNPNDGLKANNTFGDDKAITAMKALKAQLMSPGYQTLLSQSDGQKYAQAQQTIAAAKAAAVTKPTVGAAAMKAAERTPPTTEEKAKAQQHTAAAANASATGRPKTPPTQRNKDTTSPKLNG